MLAQARILGAGRRHLSVLALREAKIGVLAAIIAALGAALSEVGAVIIVGGNIQNYDQTLASAVVQQVNDYANYPYAVGISLVLLVLILVLMAILTVAPAARRRSAPALPDRRLMPAGSPSDEPAVGGPPARRAADHPRRPVR